MLYSGVMITLPRNPRIVISRSCGCRYNQSEFTTKGLPAVWLRSNVEVLNGDLKTYPSQGSSLLDWIVQGIYSLVPLKIPIEYIQRSARP